MSHPRKFTINRFISRTSNLPPCLKFNVFPDFSHCIHTFAKFRVQANGQALNRPQETRQKHPHGRSVRRNEQFGPGRNEQEEQEQEDEQGNGENEKKKETESGQNVQEQDMGNHGNQNTEKVTTKNSGSKIVQGKGAPKQKRGCIRCKKNGEPYEVYSSHISSNKACPSLDPTLVSGNAEIVPNVNPNTDETDRKRPKILSPPSASSSTTGKNRKFKTVWEM